MSSKHHREVSYQEKQYRNEPDVDIWPDYVVVCGQIVWRPSSISPAQWLQFWERK